jgi:hypothetical protein
MKHALLRPTSATFAALLGLAGLAQAHPGHSAVDWITAPPHAGHEGEYAAMIGALAIVALAVVIYRATFRKR